MAITTQTFTQMVQNSVTAIQGAATQLVDLTVGSILRSLVEAYCGLALWLQGIALQIASLTRFATSNGADADSWAADFNFTRLAAVAAKGTVTFSRFTPTASATIALGTIVQTTDGTQKFTVIADTGQSAYNATTGVYVIAAGVSNAAVTVQAVTPGAGGNVAAAAISVLGSSIPGVDTVTNALAFTSGVNAETDVAFRARYVLYLQSLTQGTKQACINAVLNMQAGASCAITENINYSGFPQPGYFYAVVDDGTGTPSGSFLTSATAAIDAVRAEGTTFGVFAPALVTANVALTIAVGSGYTLSAVKTLVISAITTYTNSLGAAATLPYTKLGQLAYDASAGITNVTAVTLNGGTADLVASGQQLIRTGTVTVGP